MEKKSSQSRKSAKVESLTGKKADKEAAKKGKRLLILILSAHNTADNMEHLKLRFDSMTSHDITFVGIVRLLRIRYGKVPIPYVLTNCPQYTLCSRRNHQ